MQSYVILVSQIEKRLRERREVAIWWGEGWVGVDLYRDRKKHRLIYFCLVHDYQNKKQGRLEESHMSSLLRYGWWLVFGKWIKDCRINLEYYS